MCLKCTARTKNDKNIVGKPVKKANVDFTPDRQLEHKRQAKACK